jgi:rod shape-determining protein MreC
MIYLRPHKRPKKWPVAVLFASTILVLIVLLRPVMPESVGTFFSTMGSQFWERETRLSALIMPLKTLITAKESLSNENEQLKKEINELKIEQLRIEALVIESFILEQISWRESETKGIVASVLVNPSRTPYDILIIDSGRNDGVEKGDLVLVNKAAIGWVTQVYSRTASVTLFSSPGTEVTVRFYAEDKAITLTAKGRGNGNFFLEVPRDIVVEEGVVVTIPASTIIPIGSVSKIIAEPSDSLQQIYFRLPVNLNELLFVELVHNEQLPISF